MTTITDWRKSSHSAYNGNCAEVGSWRKSSRSMSNEQCLEAGNWRTSTRSVNNGACTEVSSCDHEVAVRDSTDRGGPVLTFSAAAWERFAGRVKADAGVAH